MTAKIRVMKRCGARDLVGSLRMHIRLMLTAVLLLPALAAQSVSAASGSLLKDALDAWEAMDAVVGDEESVQEEEAAFQSQTDIFPELESTEEGNRLERLREERTAEFVSAEVDGSLVVFADVPRVAWFAPYVREIAELRIVSGYRDADGRPLGLFGPQDNVTIEQMAKVMVYASGRIPQDCGTAPVRNLTASGSWSAPFVSCAENLQWPVYGDGSVDVQRNATRADVVITLMQAFGKQWGQRTGTAFTDVTASTQFGAAIEQAKADGVVSGYTDAQGTPTGLFGPQDPVTRAEFAKIVTLGRQLYGMNN